MLISSRNLAAQGRIDWFPGNPDNISQGMLHMIRRKATCTSHHADSLQPPNVNGKRAILMVPAYQLVLWNLKQMTELDLDDSRLDVVRFLLLSARSILLISCSEYL